MAIADTIQSMYDNVGEVYDTITNVDLPTNKNIQNIPSTMRSSYLEIMNNGIDKIWNNWEKVTGSGTDISLSPTLEAPMKNVLNGNTYQFTTTGKNLLPNNQTTQTINGLTFTVNDDKSITIRGTATENTDYYFVGTTSQYVDFGLTTGTYNLSGCSGGSEQTYMLFAVMNRNGSIYYYGSFVDTGRKMIVETGDTFRIFIRVISGQTMNTTMYPMVERGDNKTTYEPYTGGVVPRPEYPEDIHVVSGDNSINVCGKNLFDGGDTTTTNGITFTKHSDGSYDIVGTATGPAYILNYVPLAKSGIVNGETYTISINQNIIGLETRIESYNGNTWLRATLGGLLTFPKTHSADVTGATRVRFGLFVNSGTTINLKNLKIQLEKGTTATEYEPHQSASYPINLGDIELCKIGDYQDSIVKDNGKWYLNKQINKRIFNGTENWNYQSQYPRFQLTSLSPIPLNNSNLFCSHYIKGQTADTDYVCSLASGTGYSQFLVHDERFSTKETYNTWLSSNNVTLYYVLKTPTTTEITDTTLLSQLEAIKKSYENQTNINQENNDLPFILDVTALKQLTQ